MKKYKFLIIVILLIFFNIALIILLNIERMENSQLNDELSKLNNVTQDTLLINKIIHLPVKTEYLFNLILLIPDLSCKTCVNRVINNINELIKNNYKGILVFNVGSKSNFGYMELHRIKTNVNLINQEILFNNGTLFKQPITLLVRNDGLVVESFEESIAATETSKEFYKRIRNYLNIKSI